MKDVAEAITKHLSSTVEILAAIVIGVSLLKFLYKYVKNIFSPNDGQINQAIRIQFGSSLTVALELLLAADILATAIAPTWDDIGKLAAIAVLRTALNYFLERELRTSEEDPAKAARNKIIKTNKAALHRLYFMCAINEKIKQLLSMLFSNTLSRDVFCILQMHNDRLKYPHLLLQHSQLRLSFHHLMSLLKQYFLQRYL